MQTSSSDIQSVSAITQRTVTKVEPIEFQGRLVIIGCGAVSQCLQPLLLKNLRMDFHNLTIIDMEDLKDNAKEMLDAGSK